MRLMRVGWAVWLAAGCGALVDDYAVSPPPACDLTSAESVFAAFGASADCRACLQANCSDLIIECEEDPTCLEAYTCLCEVVDPTLAICLPNASQAELTDTADHLAVCGQTSCGSTCGLGTDFTCVGNYELPGCQDGVIGLPRSFTDLLSDVPIPDVTAKVCSPFDEFCDTPAFEGQVDAEGYIEVPIELRCTPDGTNLPSGWAGYLETSAPGYPTQLIYRNYPTTYPERIDYFLPNTTLTNTVAAQLGGFEAGRGTIVVGVSDCRRFPAPGIRFSASTADASTRTFYQVGTTFSDEVEATGPFGVGGLVNLPPGVTVLTASSEDGTVVATHTVFVRADAFTNVGLLPTPAE